MELPSPSQTGILITMNPQERIASDTTFGEQRSGLITGALPLQPLCVKKQQVFICFDVLGY